MSHEPVSKAMLVSEALAATDYRLELAFARWSAYVCAFAYIAGYFPPSILLVPVFAHMASWTASMFVRHRVAQRRHAELVEQNRSRLALLATEIVRTKEAS